MNRVIRIIVEDLAVKYNFNAEDGIAFLLDQEKTKKTKKTNKKPREKKIPLPWLGDIDVSKCQALVLNYGLYTQCEEASSADLVSPFCKKCISNGQCHGTVKDRLNPKFKGNGKRPIVTYGKVLQMRGISREDAEAYAKQRGIEIPEEHFALKKPRSSKLTEKYDPNMEILEEGIDEEAEKEFYKKDKSYVGQYDSDSESDYEEINCSLFSHRGEKYLLDVYNNVYGIGEDNPFVGKYDEKKNEIDYNAEE